MNTDPSSDEGNDLDEYRHDLRMKSRRFHGAHREPAWAELQRVAAWIEEHELAADAYGDGDDLQAFEQRVASRLGLPSGRFMPSGTMAQQIAIRIWTDIGDSSAVGMHPTCHLELHEEHGYQHLHLLSPVFVGEAKAPLVAADLAELTEPISVLVVELPTRENGGLLTPFDDLVAISRQAKARGIALHLDGARLWEAAAGYGRPLAEIAGLFDSVYVSFYKGIGALPGSMLVGSADFIAEAAVWQRRQGGNLFTMQANWASAAMRLESQIDKMPSYLARAKEIAKALEGRAGLELIPRTPHVSMFHVALAGEEQALLRARDRVAKQHNLWLFGELQPVPNEDRYQFEVAIGDAAMELADDEIVEAFATLLE